MAMKLRPVMSPEDWECYHRIKQDELFVPLKLNYNRCHPCFSAENHYHYLAINQEVVIGFVHLQLYTASTCILRAIAIKKNYKNQGLGSNLLVLVEREAKNFNCDKILLHAHPKAYNFYKKNGYREMDFSWDTSIISQAIDMGKYL
jgi:GNAT superfamily N-acetyltransferase